MSRQIPLESTHSFIYPRQIGGTLVHLFLILWIRFLTGQNTKKEGAKPPLLNSYYLY